MPDNAVEVRGLDELLRQMKNFPHKLRQISEVGMWSSLNTLWEKVPSYPAPPSDSTYRRTGTLGRTLGSSEAGGRTSGEPSVFTVKRLGATEMEGRFGTNLNYAEYVIGDNQARHMGHWWKLSGVASIAQGKINKIWEGVAQKMVDFLNQKSMLE